MSKTKQEIFDATYQYFIIEKHKPAITKEYTPKCMYRGPESNCAIGCQIPDELYDPSMEHKGVGGIFSEFPKVSEYFGADNLRFCEQLQKCHDDAAQDNTETTLEDFYCDLEESLDKLAEKFELEIPDAPRGKI